MATQGPQWGNPEQMQNLFMHRDMISQNGTPQEQSADLPRFNGGTPNAARPLNPHAINPAQFAAQMAAQNGGMPTGPGGGPGMNMAALANMRANGFDPSNMQANMMFNAAAGHAGSPMHGPAPPNMSVPPQTPVSMNGASPSPAPNGTAGSPPRGMPFQMPGNPGFAQLQQHAGNLTLQQQALLHSQLQHQQQQQSAYAAQQARAGGLQPHPAAPGAPAMPNGMVNGHGPAMNGQPGVNGTPMANRHMTPEQMAQQKLAQQMQVFRIAQGLGMSQQAVNIWNAQLKLFNVLDHGNAAAVTDDLLRSIRFPKDGVPIKSESPKHRMSSVAKESQPATTLGKRKADEEAAPTEDDASPTKRAKVDGTADRAAPGPEGKIAPNDEAPKSADEPAPAVDGAPVVPAPEPVKEPSPVVPAPAVPQAVVPHAMEAPAPAPGALPVVAPVTAPVAAPVPIPVAVVHPPPPYLLEEDKDSPIYPYNAFMNPTSLLVPGRRVQIPSLLPKGLGIDAYAMQKERERFLEKRMENRLEELKRGQKAGPSKLDQSYVPTMQGKAGSAIKAIIERKALELREKQRKLRSEMVHVVQHATALPGISSMDRDVFRKQKRPDLSQVRALEKLERKQRHQREGRVRAAHRQELEVICNHGKELSMQVELAHAKQKRFGQKVQQYHQLAEKEEQKRIERISKERLKALKNDDEEAYLKLIDTAKDTRITHLLKQTDSYLDNLASMVRAQQNDDVHKEAIERELAEQENGDLVLETGPTSEETFGATRQDDPAEDSGKVDYYAVAHSIAERVSEQPSILVGGKLKEYQLKGLQWMVSLYNNRLNGILADEMGLGKTIQTISLVTYLIEKKKQQGPYLIIVPLSTITNWSLEFDKWAPSVKVIVFKGTPNQRKMMSAQVRQGNFQVVITTYEYIIKDRALLSRPKWVHMIIDEGHRLKNVQSRLSQTLTQFYISRYRLILTGTPLQNNLPELWALLNFVLPKIFNSVKSFDEWFNMPFANTGSQDKIELNEEEQLLIIRRLHKVLRPFLLRRLKKDVESELPDKVEKVIKCRMSALQQKLYNQMKSEGILYSEKTDTKGRQMGIKGLSNAIMQLRKICNHPFVFEEVERTVNPAGITDDNIWRAAGKFELLDRVLPKLLDQGHRMLIFFQMTNIMDIMEDYMRLRGHLYLRLDGGTKQEDRSTMLQAFNKPDSPYNLFLLSTRAGGLGLNLQTADTVIIFDSDWNPHADLQAQDRAHRIGQKRAVCILRLITQNSFEEEILDRARGKLDIDGKVIQAGRFDNKSTNEERERFLRSMLEQDHEQTEEAGEMNDDEINEILARSDEELEIFRKMDIERDREAEKVWRAKGGHGPKPERLMQENELPEIYRRERVMPSLLEETENLEAGGRGARARQPVRYVDEENEEYNEWLDGGSESDFDEWKAKKELKEARKQKKKGGDRSVTDTPVPDDDMPVKKKGKGRPPKKQKEDWQPSPPVSTGKRKRGDTQVSTPTVDDDDDARDAKRRKVGPTVSPQMMQRMKTVFQECYSKVASCTDEDGRKRCELFRDPPSKKLYPEYYTIIPTVMAMSIIRKRMNAGQYRSVTEFRDDWDLMWKNARTFNQEDSWVYADAVELEKVFNETFIRLTVGTDLPGAEPAAADDDAGSNLLGDDEDDEPIAPTLSRSKSNGSKRGLRAVSSSPVGQESDLSEVE